MIVNVNKSKFHGFFFLRVLVIELHLGKEQLCIIIVLNLEISPFWHETNDLSWVISCLVCLVDC